MYSNYFFVFLGLKSLELDNMSELTFRLTPKPFSKAQLTSLKLINFGVSLYNLMIYFYVSRFFSVLQ